MSNTDSFIEEVTEEVRRDRLFGYLRKYGWIGGVVVLGIVGGAAWNEWSKARAETRAQAFGDAIIDALDTGTPEERQAAFAAIPANGEQVALLQLILTADVKADTTADVKADRATTLAALDKVAADASLRPVYRDLAVLRRVLLAGTEQPLADRRAALQSIAVPGRPYRVLAEEQLAYLLVEEAKTDEAVLAMTALMLDQEATDALRARLGQMVTVLGGTVPPSTSG